MFMNENSNYPLDMFYHQQLILKLAAKEEAVQRYLSENPDTISWIINWIVDTEMTRITSNSVVRFIFLLSICFKEIFKAKTNVLRYNRFKIPKSKRICGLFLFFFRHSRVSLILQRKDFKDQKNH